MNEFQQIWDTIFRQQRLLLVTAVQAEILDWLEGMHFFSIEKDGWDITLRGKTKNGESVTISLATNDSFKQVNVSIIQKNQEVLLTGVLMTRVKYNGEYLNEGESWALKTFFRTLYDSCKKCHTSKKGELL